MKQRATASGICPLLLLQFQRLPRNGICHFPFIGMNPPIQTTFPSMCVHYRGCPKLHKVRARSHLRFAPTGTPFEATAIGDLLHRLGVSLHLILLTSLPGHRQMPPYRPLLGRAALASQGSIILRIRPRAFCTAQRARNHSLCAALVAKSCFPN